MTLITLHILGPRQLVMEIIGSETTSTILTSSRHRMPNSLQNQEGVLREKLSSLRQSHGYVATMTKYVCKLKICWYTANLTQVQNLQATLNDAFKITKIISVEPKIFLLVIAWSCRKSMVDRRLKRSGKVFTIQRLNNIPQTPHPILINKSRKI